MDRRIAYVIIAFVSAILFFVSVGLANWLSGTNPVVGPLILTAGLVVLLGGVFLILVVAMGDSWTEIAAAVTVTAAAILAIAGVLYYYANVGGWAPFIATVGMTFSVALAAVLLFDLISGST